MASSNHERTRKENNSNDINNATSDNYNKTSKATLKPPVHPTKAI